MTTLTTRSSKGSALTHGELDGNFPKLSQAKTALYTVLISDNRDTIECAGTFTITLPDAATISAASNTGDFEVTIVNTSSGVITIGRTTGADTIGGDASDLTLIQNEAVFLKVDQAASGYLISSGNKELLGVTFLQISTVGTMEASRAVTADANGDINNVGSLNDSNSNEVVTIAGVASAVNEITLTNAATGNSPVMGTAGDDPDIDLELVPKGDGYSRISGGATGGVQGALYLLDTPEEIVNGTSVASWTTVASTTLLNAEAKAVLLKVYSSNIATTTVSIAKAYIRPTGSALADDNTTLACIDRSTSANSAQHIPIALANYTVAVNGLGEIDYHGGANTGTINIFIMGFYV